MLTQRDSDEALMAAYAAGEARALRELHRRHAGKLLRVLSARMGSASDAQDIVQAAFLNLHRARKDFREGARLQPWLYTIAFNLMRDHYRYRGRRPEELTEPTRHDARRSEARGPDANLHDQPVRDALAQLPEGQREVIMLHWYEGFSFAEIAEIVGARRSAVKVRAHRGYKRLRELLDAPLHVTTTGAQT